MRALPLLFCRASSQSLFGHDLRRLHVNGYAIS